MFGRIIKRIIIENIIIFSVVQIAVFEELSIHFINCKPGLTEMDVSRVLMIYLLPLENIELELLTIKKPFKMI